jgi:hypothetical protein
MRNHAAHSNGIGRNISSSPWLSVDFLKSSIYLVLGPIASKCSYALPVKSLAFARHPWQNIGVGNSADRALEPDTRSI